LEMCLRAHLLPSSKTSTSLAPARLLARYGYVPS
jgi:hypothetical protein